MKGFVLGVIVTSLAWGGFFYWERQDRLAAQQAEEAADARQAAADAQPAAGKDRQGRRRRRRPRADRLVAGGTDPASVNLEDYEDEPEPEPLQLGAADLRSTARGQDLSAPDVLQLDMNGADDGSSSLDQSEIDGVFRAQQARILSCIQSARPDEITYVPGKVTIKFRIQRTGQVRGVRVEAPNILHKGGLYDCLAGVVGGLRFRASNGSQVVTYPYQLS